MTDHWHYASDIHGGAEEHHRHYDDENRVAGLREDLGRAEARISELEDSLRDALERIRALEGQTPQARQLQFEADLAATDLAGSDYGPDDCPAISDAGTQCSGQEWHMLPHRDGSGYEWGEDE